MKYLKTNLLLASFFMLFEVVLPQANASTIYLERSGSHSAASVQRKVNYWGKMTFKFVKKKWRKHSPQSGIGTGGRILLTILATIGVFALGVFFAPEFLDGFTFVSVLFLILLFALEIFVLSRIWRKRKAKSWKLFELIC